MTCSLPTLKVSQDRLTAANSAAFDGTAIASRLLMADRKPVAAGHHTAGLCSPILMESNMANMSHTPGSTPRDRAEQAGASSGRKVGETLEHAREGTASTAQHIQENAENVAQRVQDMATDVGKRVRDAGSTVAHKAEEIYGGTTEAINSFNQDVMHLINRHPKQAVLIGFGVGCLVGMLAFGGVFAGADGS